MQKHAKENSATSFTPFYQPSFQPLIKQLIPLVVSDEIVKLFVVVPGVVIPRRSVVAGNRRHAGRARRSRRRAGSGGSRGSARGRCSRTGGRRITLVVIIGASRFGREATQARGLVVKLGRRSDADGL